MNTRWTGWAVVVLVALLFSVALARIASGSVDVPGLIAGWVLAAASSAVALFLNKRSIGMDSARFFRFGLLGNGLRFLSVASVLIIFVLVNGCRCGSFATALVVSYLVLMVYEVWSLYGVGATVAGGGKRAQSSDMVSRETR